MSKEVSKNQLLIQDVLRAAYRSSPLLFDNLGISIDAEMAYRVYCEAWNKAPKAAIADGVLHTGLMTPVEDYKTPDTLTEAEKKQAVLMWAHMEAEKWGR